MIPSGVIARTVNSGFAFSRYTNQVDDNVMLWLLNVYRIICFTETFVYTSTISAYPSSLLRELKHFGILHTVVIPFS